MGPTGLDKVLPPNSYSFSLHYRFQEHLKALRSECQLTLDISHTLCAVGYDFGSRSIRAMSLHMNFSAVFMIWVFSSPCWRLAWCSRRMRSYSSSQAPIVMAIAATGDAVWRRVVSSASQHVEFATALHARMLFMMELKKTQILTAEAFHMVDQYYATNWNKCKRGRGRFLHYGVAAVKNKCLQSTQNHEKPLVWPLKS